MGIGWAKGGIQGSYERIDVAPDDLQAFLAGLREGRFAGGNVTIPAQGGGGRARR